MPVRNRLKIGPHFSIREQKVKRFARTSVILLTFLAIGWGVTLSTPARSDYEAGVEAYSKGDFKTAMAEWLPLAEGGDAIAQNSVGALYDRGLGVDEDDATAVYWYQKAADQDLPLAMRNLASKYASGHGVPYDKALAESWYAKAAEMGDSGAIQHLTGEAPAAEFAATTESLDVSQENQEAVPPAPASKPMTVAADDGASEEAPAVEPVVDAAPAPEAPAAAPTAPATQTSATADASGQAAQYGEESTSSAAAAPPSTSAAPTPAATQQAAVTPPPSSDPANWLIGMWQGPSLGCPPNGGLEFGPGETRSYYGGQVATKMQAKYQISGDRIAVTTVGVDGVGHTYEYERKGANGFVIATVPQDMPSSMIGVEHHRCGQAPATVAAAPQPAPAPEPAATPAPVVALTPAPAPEVATAAPAAPKPVVQAPQPQSETQRPVQPSRRKVHQDPNSHEAGRTSRASQRRLSTARFACPSHRHRAARAHREKATSAPRAQSTPRGECDAECQPADERVVKVQCLLKPARAA